MGLVLATLRATICIYTVVRRVLVTAKSLGYRQNKLVSALRGGQSRVVGVCLSDIENPVFPPIVRGIEDQFDPLLAAGTAR